MDFAALERRRLDGIVRADRDPLDELHHPDFVLCTPSGGGGHLECGHLECCHLDVDVHDGGCWRCRWSQATDTVADS